MDEELNKEVADPTVCVFSGYAMYQAIEAIKGLDEWRPDTVSSYVTQADINLGKMEACGLKIPLEVKELAQSMMHGSVAPDLSDDEKLEKLKRQANDLDGKIWTMLGKARGY